MRFKTIIYIIVLTSFLLGAVVDTGTSDMVFHWNSKLAKIILSNYHAVTIGNHIYVREKQTYYNNTWHIRIVIHEGTHIKQYQRYGFFNFIFKYAFMYIKYGYAKHPLEIEARNAVKERYGVAW